MMNIIIVVDYANDEYNNNTNNEYNIVVDYGIGGHGIGALIY